MANNQSTEQPPVIDHNCFMLYDKMIFEKAVLKPPFSMPNNMEKEACFMYVLNGSYNAISEQETFHVATNDAVLMKCGNFVGQMRPSSESEVYEAVAIHFYPDVLKKVYANEVPSILKSRDRQTNRQMAKVGVDELLQKYIDSIVFYFANPNLVTEELLVLKVKELILLLAQSNKAPVIHDLLANLFRPVAVTFKEVVEAHIFTPITVEELAILNNMSLSSFKREFKRIYDDSPAQYIRKRKLRQSADLLLVSEDNISHIAWDCGFQDITHFSRAFKQHFGMSPTEYRLARNANQLN